MAHRNVLIVAFFTSILFPSLIYAASFDRTLSLGSRGSDVRALQEILNKEVETQVAVIGPGSRGQETEFFGAKTAAAVRKFQEKYAREVLLPHGLLRGTGIVGPSTRAQLSRLSVSEPSFFVEELPATPPPISKSPATSSMPQRNREHLEGVLSAMRGLYAEQGRADVAESAISSIRDEALTTTTDYAAKFAEDVRRSVGQTSSSPKRKAVFGLARFGIQLEFVRRAEAAALPHFGGLLVYMLPCTCTGGEVWYLGFFNINNKPSPYALLSYALGSQAFRNYNLPLYGVFAKGLYVPGVQSCIMYIGTACSPIPGLGQVSPVVGSSLTPL